MKKALSVILALVLIFSAVPLSGISEYLQGLDFGFLAVKSSAASESDLSFELNGDGKSYYVSVCNQSASGELEIPATYKGKPVASIGNNAFYYRSSLTSVTIPDSVTSIGESAFYGCSSLTSVTIPGSVTSIGNYAFYYCSSLTSVTIGNGVTSIGNSAFYGCSSLTSINVAADNKYYSSQDGVLFNKDKTELICCPAGKSGAYTIPNSVTSIGDRAFYECSSLTSVTIPDSVTSIGSSAFSGCSSLISVAIPDSVTIIGDDAFYGCSSLTSVTIPDSVTSIGEGAFWRCSSLTSIEIPDSVTSIGGYAFYNCSSLTGITIPDSVASIGACAFYGCSSLTSVTIPDSVTSIGNYAFDSCSSLTSVTIPDSVTSIGEYAFYGCSSLTSINVAAGNENYSSQDGVLFNKDKTELICCPGGNTGAYTIPSSVTSIGWGAFLDCSSLTSVTIPDSVTSIGNYAFDSCSSLTSVTIPDSVTSIGDYAFYDCSNLTSVTIPDSVTSIGDFAFCRCSSLTSVTIPDSVTSIGGSAFCECSSLTSINVSADNKYYSSQDGVLFNKDKTELICCPEGKTGAYTIPNRVTNIGSIAFLDCINLTSVTIPDSVTSIGGQAFYYCSSLTSVTIPDSVTSIGWYAFEYCGSLVIYGFSGSYAKTYAGNNSIAFQAVKILPNANTRIDYANNCIFSGKSIKSLDDCLICDTNIALECVKSSFGFIGTGTIVNIKSGDTVIDTYTVVVNGDLDGDGVSDVLDAVLTERALNGHGELSDAQAYAANNSADTEISIESYQNVVNRALSA